MAQEGGGQGGQFFKTAQIFFTLPSLYQMNSTAALDRNLLSWTPDRQLPYRQPLARENGILRKNKKWN